MSQRFHTLLAFSISFAFWFSTSVLAQANAEVSPQSHSDSLRRDANVPELPFADNPDPTLCGIPVPWVSDEPAWLSGYYQGELIQPVVLLYDSHLRRSITGEAPTGTEVTVLLSQSNPSLNYYLVRTLGQNPQEGWVPEPFLKLESAQ